MDPGFRRDDDKILKRVGAGKLPMKGASVRSDEVVPRSTE
jgi:hypothetical protein